MNKRIALAIVFVPILLAAFSLLGLLFGATGTAISLALRDQTEIKTLGFRVIVTGSIVIVSFVGVVRILNWFLGVAQRLGYRSPALRQAASDSLLLVVGFGGLVGIAFLAFAVLGLFRGQRLPLLVCGAILTAAASSILVPRIRRAKDSIPRAPGSPPSGAVSAGVPRAPESTAAQAGRVAS